MGVLEQTTRFKTAIHMYPCLYDSRARVVPAPRLRGAQALWWRVVSCSDLWNVCLLGWCVNSPGHRAYSGQARATPRNPLRGVRSIPRDDLLRIFQDLPAVVLPRHARSDSPYHPLTTGATQTSHALIRRHPRNSPARSSGCSAAAQQAPRQSACVVVTLLWAAAARTPVLSRVVQPSWPRLIFLRRVSA